MAALTCCFPLALALVPIHWFLGLTIVLCIDVICYLSIVGATFTVSQLLGQEDYDVCQILLSFIIDLRCGVAAMRKRVIRCE